MDIVTIQKELAKRGLYKGQIDGIIGKGTNNGIDAALSSFNTKGWRQARKLIGFEQLVYKELGFSGDVDGLIGPVTLKNREAYHNKSVDQPPTPPIAKPAQSPDIPRVVDIYWRSTVDSFQAAKDSGIWGIIHKSSEGATFRDPKYAERRIQATQLGLLWGAYHFNSGAKPSTQVDFFMKCAQPDENTLMVLDYEDGKSNMSIGQMVEFLHLIEDKLGRKAALYSGNKIKETILRLSESDYEYVRSHRLWLAQYGPKAKLPKGWDKYWLWQYSGDGVGPLPHEVPGIYMKGGKGIDMNRVQPGQTFEQFAATWA